MLLFVRLSWWRRIVGKAEHLGATAGSTQNFVRSTNLQIVVHLTHATDFLNQVFGEALFVAAANAAGEGHFSLVDAHFDILGVHARVVCQAIADVLANPLIAPLIAARA